MRAWANSHVLFVPLLEFNRNIGEGIEKHAAAAKHDINPWQALSTQEQTIRNYSQ
jgi:hypothetical protein